MTHNRNPVYEDRAPARGRERYAVGDGLRRRQAGGHIGSAKQQIRSDLEKFRMQAWHALLPKLGGDLREAPARNNLVTAHIAAADPANNRRAISWSSIRR